MKTQTQTQTHTAGPWESFGTSIHHGRHLPEYWTAVGLSDGNGGTCRGTTGVLAYCDPDNAALIAAAPDLLAALRVSENALDAYSGGESADLETIRQAIAKVEAQA